MIFPNIYLIKKYHNFTLGDKLKNKIHLLKIFQYYFPDTANFNGRLLDITVPINAEMETYCEQALVLIYPHRSLSDLNNRISYTHKFYKSIFLGK